MQQKIPFPTKPYLLGQKFGENLACSFPDRTGVVTVLSNGTCPAGKVKLYPLLGMKGHTGEDTRVASGTPLYSPLNGFVREMQTERERGLGIGIVSKERFDLGEHGVHFIKVRMWHLDKFNVTFGQEVRRGQIVAWSDNTGLSSGPHLHYEDKPVEYYPGTNAVYNTEQQNGWFGAIDPALLWDGKYAEDDDGFTWNFQYDLEFGSEGEEVRFLQTILQILGFFPKDHPLTNFYGTITRKGVEDFQIRYNILPPWLRLRIFGFGRFGPRTRAHLNLLINA